MECKVCGKETNRHKRARTCFDCHALVQALIIGKVTSIMMKAKSRGILKELDGEIKCVDCGKPAKSYDHRDYFKPLNVDPVCLSCNRIRGSAKNRENLIMAKKYLWDKNWIKDTKITENVINSHKRAELLFLRVEELWKREKKRQNRINTKTTS